MELLKPSVVRIKTIKFKYLLEVHHGEIFLNHVVAIIWLVTCDFLSHAVKKFIVLVYQCPVLFNLGHGAGLKSESQISPVTKYSITNGIQEKYTVVFCYCFL